MKTKLKKPKKEINEKQSKFFYDLRKNQKITWKKIAENTNLNVGTVWYRAKTYAEKTNQHWPIELNKPCIAEQVYNYRLEGYSWWKISKKIDRSMRLCKMYSKEWAKRNKRSLDPILT